MGQFNSATEFGIYQNCICKHCIHHTPAMGEWCPVMELHWLWHTESDKESLPPIKRFALDLFIPREGEGNGVCRQFTLPEEPAVAPPERCQVVKLVSA